MVEFEWDEHNSNHIWDRHQVSIYEAEEAFADPRRVPRQATPHPMERRRVILGSTEAGRLLHLVYLWQERRIRIVSARDATGQERRIYQRRGK